MEKKKENQAEFLDDYYKATFNFTEGDLASNRAGFISHPQQKHIKYRLATLLFGMISPTIFLGFMSGLGILAWIAVFVRWNSVSFLLALLSLPLILLFLLIVYGMVGFIHEVWLDLREKRVMVFDSLEQFIAYKEAQRRWKMSFIPREFYRIKSTARIYTSPRTMMILSVDMDFSEKDDFEWQRKAKDSSSPLMSN